jgi:hypothetical protein
LNLEAEPPVEDVLTKIRANLAEIEASLPDFICNEKLVSKRVVKGKVARETAVESLFTGVQQPDRKAHLPFTESREITRVDGKAVPKGSKLKAPLVFGGGFSSVSSTTFNPKNAEFQTFKLAGTETRDGRPALVLEFATKDEQTHLALARNGTRIVTQDAGKAWIDPDSMQVLRLERRYETLTAPKDALRVEIDYARVVIDGKAFQMPKRVRAEQEDPKGNHRESRSFVAEYGNYRKFNVSTGISFQ